MAEAEYTEEEILWELISDSFEPYQRRNTDYITDQLEFMNSVQIAYPDETKMNWGEDMSERYEKLVDSFGEIDQYLEHLEDGSMVIYAEDENDPLFIAYGLELSRPKSSSFGLSAISNALSAD